MFCQTFCLNIASMFFLILIKRNLYSNKSNSCSLRNLEIERAIPTPLGEKKIFHDPFGIDLDGVTEHLLPLPNKQISGKN